MPVRCSDVKGPKTPRSYTPCLWLSRNDFAKRGVREPGFWSSPRTIAEKMSGFHYSLLLFFAGAARGNKCRCRRAKFGAPCGCSMSCCSRSQMPGKRGACSAYEVLDWVGAGLRSPLASPGHLLPLLRAHTLVALAGYVASRLFQFETRTRQSEGFVQDSVYSEAARVDRLGDDELDDGRDQDRR